MTISLATSKLTAANIGSIGFRIPELKSNTTVSSYRKLTNSNTTVWNNRRRYKAI